MSVEKVETTDGVFYVRPLKYREVRKVMKDSGATRVRVIGSEMPEWSIDIMDVQFYLLLEAVTLENGEKISVEKLDSLSVETIDILTKKALELTPIFRFMATG